MSVLEEHLVLQGRSPATIRLYRDAIRRLEAACGAPALEITPGALASYVASLGVGRSTLSHLRSALRALEEAAGAPVRLSGAVRVPHKRRMRCRALSEPQAALLASHAASRGDRPGLAVLAGLYLALRRAEIAAMRAPTGSWIRVLGKGNVVSLIPLHPAVARALGAQELGISPWVFPGRDGRGHVCPATIWGWVREVAADAGVAGVSPHVLRHTALATSLDACGDLRAVMELARHVRPETTACYTRTSSARLVAASAAISYGGLP